VKFHWRLFWVVFLGNLPLGVEGGNIGRCDLGKIKKKKIKRDDKK
jgi:hypothetical protein